MICVTRKYSVENYVFFFDKVVVLGFDLVSGAITITSAPPCLIEERFSGHGCHTLYFYITTVVINEKKHSFDELCIEIIANVHNWSFKIFSMHNTSNERLFSFNTTVIFRNDCVKKTYLFHIIFHLHSTKVTFNCLIFLSRV